MSKSEIITRRRALQAEELQRRGEQLRNGRREELEAQGMSSDYINSLMSLLKPPQLTRAEILELHGFTTGKVDLAPADWPRLYDYLDTLGNTWPELPGAALDGRYPRATTAARVRGLWVHGSDWPAVRRFVKGFKPPGITAKRKAAGLVLRKIAVPVEDWPFIDSLITRYPELQTPEPHAGYAAEGVSVRRRWVHPDDEGILQQFLQRPTVSDGRHAAGLQPHAIRALTEHWPLIDALIDALQPGGRGIGGRPCRVASGPATRTRHIHPDNWPAVRELVRSLR